MALCVAIRTRLKTTESTIPNPHRGGLRKMKIGDEIGIQCEVRPGPFSEERMITFDTKHGPISGFVQESDLNLINSQWYVRAIVQEVISEDELAVRVKGSFFTTNGLATVPRRYAMAA
jgi:hypothetical protein